MAVNKLSTVVLRDFHHLQKNPHHTEIAVWNYDFIHSHSSVSGSSSLVTLCNSYCSIKSEETST